MAKTESRELPLLEPLVTGNMKAAIKSAGGKSSDLWKVPHDKLHYDPLDNVRPLDPAHVRHIADLIKANDYDDKEPLGGIIKKVNDEDLIFVYIGQHRFQGALLAISEGWRPKDWKEEDGPVKLPIVIDAAKTVSRKAMIVAGTNSNGGATMTPLDLAASIQALQREGETTASICNLLGITDQTVRDVLLLAAAPAELHDLVRSKHVASTLAIEEIRAHGPDKALERLRQGLETARQSGKTKVTRKALPKAVIKAITPDQAKLLLNALQLVVTDPGFGKLAVSVRDAALAAATPFGTALDAVLPATKPDYPIVVPNEHDVYPASETVELTVSKKVLATIWLSRVDTYRWRIATRVNMTASSYATCAKSTDDGVQTWATIEQATAAAIMEISNYIQLPPHKKQKEYRHIDRWLDQLVIADEKVGHFVELNLSIQARRRAHSATYTAAPAIDPAAMAWPFPRAAR
jgi:hypothetical protein